MKKIVLPFLLIVCFGYSASSQFTQLFFSEYIEGSSNNKAIEIYNPTNAPIDLTLYKLYRYNNGSAIAQDSLAMPGMLAAGAVYVAGNPSADPAILNQSDTLHTITFFNGDDVIELRRLSDQVSLDIIGVIGVDPGTNWTVGTGATSEYTLVRKPTISGGTTNWVQSATEWDVHPQNTFSFLGSHTINPSLPVKLVSFTGAAKQQSALLQWTVAEQLGIDWYEVQKSSNGEDFVTIAKVTANTSRNHTYSYTDMNIAQAKLFYRLKVAERQKASYSRVLNLNKVNKGGILVYPTIAQHSLFLQSDNAAMLNTTVEIYSNSGARMKAVTVTQLPMNIHVGDLAAGVYFLKTNATEKPFVQKFVKQ